MDYQKLLLDHLELLDRVVRYTARRHHLSAADVEDFSSLVRVKLIDRDFAVLRKFQGRSALSTYLTTVVDRLFLDFCSARWGKWRPSTAAERLGPVATQLEQLVSRDGLSFDEAVTTLQTNHGCTLSRDELHALFEQLPVRQVRRHVDEKELAAVAALVGPHEADPIEQAEDERLAGRIEQALMRAVAGLTPREQLILKLRFQHGMTVADVGRLLDLPQKTLYRDLHDLIARLQHQLLQENIDRHQISRVMGHPSITLGRVFDEERSAPVGETKNASV